MLQIEEIFIGRFRSFYRLKCKEYSSMDCTGPDEVRFRNFLAKCKQRVVEKLTDDLWRTEQYLSYLDELLKKLKLEHSATVSKDVLNQYSNDVIFLHSIIDAEKQPNCIDKLQAMQNIQIPNSDEIASTSGAGGLSLKNVKEQKCAQLSNNQRHELLSNKRNESFSNLRLRKAGEVLETNNTDIDAVLKHHYELQEKLAEDFLTMTLHLKHNVTVAGQVVREDHQSLERTTSTANRNVQNLANESLRLDKFLNALCDGWLWIMMGIVFVTFICMILFMRLFPKKY